MNNKSQKTKEQKQTAFYMFFPIILIIIFSAFLTKYQKSGAFAQVTEEQSIDITDESETTTETIIDTILTPVSQYPYMINDTVFPEMRSEYGILINADNSQVLASKNSTEVIYPASLTKVMTLIVAVENIEDIDDTFTMTFEILSPLVKQNASRAGFLENENIKIIDLLYGAILPSGADATVGLAEYVSGSEEEFVKLMNNKAKELGLRNTHFANSSGLHNKEHYSTLTDMSVILQYAIKNPLCREILSTYKYTTNKTEQHPEGINLVSNMFAKMKGDEAQGVQILGGKTGYTDEAGQCLASFAVKDGTTYIAVSTKGSGSYSMIYDAIDLYSKYIQ